MTLTLEFCTQRARAAEAAAENTQLDNVRERELRSARAWRQMAERQRRIDSERAKADAERADRRAAERAEAEALRLASKSVL